jgi:carbon-monoxide dehydrogenase large subunit
VSFIETRREHLLAVTQQRDQWYEVELGLSRDGRIVALRDAFGHDCGAFVSWGIIVPLITSVSVPGPLPRAELRGDAHRRLYERGAGDPVRGAGRPQAFFVMAARGHPSPLDPLGVKGAGEGGTLPAPAAIANAAADALHPLGVEVTEMPLTRERLWRRVQASSRSRRQGIA